MKAKKSLGQNFLKSQEVAQAIVKAAVIESKDIVLEIGPGKGALTEHLLSSGAKVFAVEKDKQLVDYLEEKFSDPIKYGKLTVIEDDILKFDTDNFLSETNNYKIVANIPYYITGLIIRKIFSYKNFPENIVLLVQKEVAERIVDRKESVLSLVVKAFGKPKLIRVVKAHDFSPAPKVDSAVLLIDNVNRDFFIEEKIGEEEFFSLIKTGFSHKRKFLLGNLSKIFEKQTLREIFDKIDIPQTARAEDVALEKWRKLYIQLKDRKF